MTYNQTIGSITGLALGVSQMWLNLFTHAYTPTLLRPPNLLGHLFRPIYKVFGFHPLVFNEKIINDGTVYIYIGHPGI